VPELPDITVYLDALSTRVLGRTLERVEVVSRIVLRSVEPPLAVCHGSRVAGLRRLGKRIVADRARFVRNVVQRDCRP
jgi:formamidopyrimidine-DNA glycosylase